MSSEAWEKLVEAYYHVDCRRFKRGWTRMKESGVERAVFLFNSARMGLGLSSGIQFRVKHKQPLGDKFGYCLNEVVLTYTRKFLQME